MNLVWKLEILLLDCFFNHSKSSSSSSFPVAKWNNYYKYVSYCLVHVIVLLTDKENQNYLELCHEHNQIQNLHEVKFLAVNYVYVYFTLCIWHSYSFKIPLFIPLQITQWRPGIFFSVCNTFPARIYSHYHLELLNTLSCYLSRLLCK